MVNHHFNPVLKCRIEYIFVDNGTNYPRFFLFYRTGPIENESYENTLSSIWVDGNSSAGTILDNNAATFTNISSLSSDNYSTASGLNNTVRIPNNTQTQIIGNDLVVKVSSVPVTNTTYTTYIYCRFGNSMAYNVTYESVTLSIS